MVIKDLLSADNQREREREIAKRIFSEIIMSANTVSTINYFIIVKSGLRSVNQLLPEQTRITLLHDFIVNIYNTIYKQKTFYTDYYRLRFTTTMYIKE